MDFTLTFRHGYLTGVTDDNLTVCPPLRRLLKAQALAALRRRSKQIQDELVGNLTFYG